MDVESDAVAVASHQSSARNYVKFYPKWVRSNFLSEQEGREVGAYQDFVMIICPGQPKSEVHREVQDKDRAEYRSEWEAYKAGKEQRLTGTPIELLPGMDQARADSLKAIYIHTIEQLAQASEPAKQAIGMGANELVQRAAGYLQKNSAEVANLKAENASLKAQLAALSERLSAPRKPGRPRKNATPSVVQPQ